MGEYLLREAVEDAGLAGQVEVDSYGTSAEELGNGMDPRARDALRRNGSRDLGWGSHRARRFRPDDFDTHDLVLAADHVHHRLLLRSARSEADRAKVALLRSFDPESAKADDLGMADPWYGDDADFDVTYRQVRAALPGIIARAREGRA